MSLIFKAKRKEKKIKHKHALKFSWWNPLKCVVSLTADFTRVYETLKCMFKHFS